MKYAGIIIAKGDSRRLPRKNLLPLCGLPLVEWSLIQLDAAKQVDDIYVVTDSDEIAELSRPYHARIVWQPKSEIDRAEERGWLGGPTSYMRGMRVAAKDGYSNFALCMPTGVLRRPGDIDRLIEIHRVKQDRYVCTMIRYTDIDVWVMKDDMLELLIFDKQGKVYRTTANGAAVNMETYDKLYFRGNWEPLDLNTHLKDIKLYWPAVDEPWQETDIDYQADFEVCEYWMEKKILNGGGKEVYYDSSDHSGKR